MDRDFKKEIAEKLAQMAALDFAHTPTNRFLRAVRADALYQINHFHSWASADMAQFAVDAALSKFDVNLKEFDIVNDPAMQQIVKDTATVVVKAFVNYASFTNRPELYMSKFHFELHL